MARRGRTGGCHRGEVEIAFPVDIVGPNLSTLLATVCGNLYELDEVTGLRLLDLDLTASYATQFPGPQFGIAGTRDKAGMHGRPIIGTIIKPSIGLTPGQTASLVDSLCQADIDFIKDDELMADPPDAPFEAWLAAVMPVLHNEGSRAIPEYGRFVPLRAPELRWAGGRAQGWADKWDRFLRSGPSRLAMTSRQQEKKR